MIWRETPPFSETSISVHGFWWVETLRLHEVCMRFHHGTLTASEGHFPQEISVVQASHCSHTVFQLQLPCGLVISLLGFRLTKKLHRWASLLFYVLTLPMSRFASFPFVTTANIHDTAELWPYFFLTLNISQLAILQNRSLWLLLTYFGLHLSSSSSSSSSLWLDCGSRSLTKSQLPLSFHRSSYLGTRCSSWSREANRPTTGRRDVIDKHRLTASGFWAHVSMKSEIVADGSASQMAANNCPLGKSIWRLWSLIFSSHDTRLQISNARSELIAFKHNTSCPSNV